MSIDSTSKKNLGSQNKMLNTSSGQTISFVVDDLGDIVSVSYHEEGSGHKTVFGDAVEEISKKYRLPNSKKPLSGEDILRLVESGNGFAVVREIQERTNQTLGLL